jgi:ParB-like chromosome segregation protein Spo0J
MTAAKVKKLAWPADKVERWPVDSLVPYAKNSRTHSKEQVDQIVKSMAEFGFTMPILVAEDGTIIAGHGRVMAAKKAGYDEVPVMVAVGWTEKQKRAYTIADNKLALNSGWDDAMLKTEIRGLNADGFDLTLTGFSLEEQADLFVEADLGTAPPRDAGDLNTVIQFNIVFDDEGQQEQWFAFVRHLKATYPDAQTLGERLAAFTEEQGISA